MHGFVVTGLAFVIAKNTSSTKGNKSTTPKPLQEALLSISADKSCCVTRAVYNLGNDNNNISVSSVYIIYTWSKTPQLMSCNYQIP